MPVVKYSLPEAAVADVVEQWHASGSLHPSAESLGIPEPSLRWILISRGFAPPAPYRPTETGRKIKRFVLRFRAKHGMDPSIAAIARSLGRARNSTWYAVKRLQARGEW